MIRISIFRNLVIWFLQKLVNCKRIEIYIYNQRKFFFVEFKLNNKVFIIMKLLYGCFYVFYDISIVISKWYVFCEGYNNFKFSFCSF